VRGLKDAQDRLEELAATHILHVLGREGALAAIALQLDDGREQGLEVLQGTPELLVYHRANVGRKDVITRLNVHAQEGFPVRDGGRRNHQFVHVDGVLVEIRPLHEREDAEDQIDEHDDWVSKKKNQNGFLFKSNQIKPNFFLLIFIFLKN